LYKSFDPPIKNGVKVEIQEEVEEDEEFPDSVFGD